MIAVGAAGAVYGVSVSGNAAAFKAYLFGYIFWLCMTLGFFGVSLLHHMLRTRWGLPVVRLWEAGGGWFSIVASGLMGIPLIVGMPILYKWSLPEVIAKDPIVAHKVAYLNPTFFVIRFVIYFASFALIAYVNHAWTKKQEATGDVIWEKKRSQFSAVGMVWFVLASSLMFTDLVMSIDPHWFSTIYGVWFITGQALATFALAAVVIGTQADRQPYSGWANSKLLVDLSHLLLASTMFWAYVSLSQYLIIWNGNMPEFNIYYLNRSELGWAGLSSALMVGQFFAPFMFLMMPAVKRNAKTLAFVAGWILVFRVVDVYYIVKPSFEGASIVPSVLEVSFFLLVGGIWLVLFATQLKRTALIPTYASTEATNHA